MHRTSPATKAALYLTLLTLTQCSKCKNDPAPSGELPAATQEGKNTFGCLVNGKVWTPDGRTGLRPNLVVDYQPDPVRGGNLNISAYNYAGANNSKQTIQLSAGPIFQARTFRLDTTIAEGAASFFDRGKPKPCDELLDYDVSYLKGTLTLTRLDQSAGVIAGTFEFKIAKPGCDTVRVTQGRFDWKL